MYPLPLDRHGIFFFFFFPWNRLSSFDQQSFSVLNVNVVMEDACVMV